MNIKKTIRMATMALSALLCFGTATALADSINLSEVTANTNVVDGTTLTGTLGANVQISIADGATVTLKDVTITNLGNGCHWAGINCPGDAILVLEGANTVCAGGNSSGYHNYPGIWIAPEKTLTIQGDGSLVAYSGTGNAAWASGIGGGYEIDCGNIVIEGGTINATGGKSAAGIGCGYHAACGDIIINGGTITATGGRSSAGIGCGYEASCGNIVITGGTIASTGGMYSSALGGGYAASCGDITIASTVTSVATTNTPTSGAVSDCIGAGPAGGTCGTVTIGGVTGVVLESPYTFMPVDLSSVTEGTTIPNGATLCGTLASNVKISIAPGATVTLGGAKINGEGTWTDGDYAGITCEGNATIILRGENNVKGFNADYPGIYVPEGSTLTITGGVTGTLDASSNGAGAGIGGGNGISCGNIVIAGGVITATGGTGAAGIGGGSGAACGDMTITDASFGVTATKGEDAPYSIGAGKDGSGGTVTIGNEVGAIEDSPYTCNLPIDLSNVTAARTIPDGKTITGTLGATVKISIARNATVTLKDATINGVHNTDSYYAWSWAGITCEGDATIILEGENAVRGFCADYPGIFVPEGSTLTIQGEGSLDASSNGWGAGIGGGDGSEYYLSCGNIVIEGGTIVATGGKYAAAIGSGEYSDCGTITIADSVTSVKAVKGEGAEDSIGKGSNGTCGTVTIGGTEYPDGIAGSPYTYINLAKVTEDTVIPDGATVFGTLGTNVKISIADGATVTLDGVTINGVNDEDNCSWAGITCEGGATIILKGANTVKGFYEDYPGIHVPEGKTLTIKGDGSLDASSNGYGAGIGGGNSISCGNIAIKGGTITATGDGNAAGIGGGFGISCGNIVVVGGTIVATGDGGAAGIGSGFSGECGDITISNTVTKVVATKGGNAPCSIGNGSYGTCGTVTIGGTVYPDGITQSPYIYPSYTATLKDGTEDAANWTITPNEGVAEKDTVTVAYAGENKVKSVKAVAIPLTLSAATAEDIGKVVCADGHLHDAKTAVPDGCTAVGIIGKVTETGHGLILALQNATQQNWNTINGWASTTDYAGTTLKVLPDDAARGGNLTSYTKLGETAVSDWAVAQKSDYEAIFTNLGSKTGDEDGKVYDANVNDYITGVGGAAISDYYCSATEGNDDGAWNFGSAYWNYYDKASSSSVRPVLGFGGEATAEIAVTPVEGKPNEWTFQMPDGDVEVKVAYLAVATFEVEGETYAVITNVVGKAVETPAADPVKAGHSFAGWFTEATGGTQVTDETMMGIADTTFYAQFREPILTIENGVLTAVDFNGCTNVALTIPDTVTTIGESAFYQCTGLASVTIPGSVKTISHAAFRDCSNLTSVTIEEGVTTIGERAFARCVNLASITIPGTVTEIGEAAFSDCRSLASLTIPGSVKTIGPQAFQNCTGLESVTIEEGVETIRRVAFDGCENLSSVTIPDSVKEIGDDAFAGCSDALYEEGSGNLSGVKLVDGWAVGYDAGSISENLDLTGVRGIAGGAFAGCDVITSVIIPDGVATIPEYVFNGCDNLTSVTIPDSVTSIGEGAFGGCDNLASVTIPDSVTSIGKDAFEGCSEDLYDTTTIPGVRLVDGWAIGYTDALPENLDLTGVRGIADNAFRESKLESVTIPGTVARVPASAFMSCSSLASVTLEEGVTAIDDSAFIECSALESVEIPDTVTAIGSQAFVACAKLASVTVPGSVVEIGPAAFGMCSSLTNVTLEAGVTNIGMMAFAMCSALESVEIPDTVTAIGSQAFFMSMNLASVTIPSSVMEIGQEAFAYTALATVKVSYGDGERVKEMLAASGFDVSKLTFVEPYKLTFDPNGGEFAEGVETNRFLYAGAELGELPEATCIGHTFAGWLDENYNEVAATNTMGEADATVYAQWTINQYTITFDPAGGSDVASITNDYGTAVTAPADPAKTGYTFSGWTPAVPETIPASNTVCTAGWTVNQYTISFDVNGGEGEFDPATLDYGAGYGELPVPVRTGYTFLGWFDGNGNEATAETVLGDADVALAARWGINRYTITFDSNGGSDVAAITNDYGAAVTAPADPAKTGYTFAGWMPAVPATVPASNTTCVAGWSINSHLITFDLNGGEGEFDPVSLDYGAEYGELPVPVRTGYTFKGWTDGDGNEVTAETVLGDADVTLKAQWEINQYTITFVVEGETYAAITNDYGAAVTAPEAPTKTGYTFAGWDPEIPETIPAEDLDITAKWTAKRAAFEKQLSGDLATVADKAEAIAGAFDGIEAITNLIAEIDGVTVVQVAGTVFGQIMASAEEVEVNDEIREGLKAVLGMTDDEITALPNVLVVDPFAFLTGKKVGLAYGEHGYILGEASAADICEIAYTGSKGNEYTIVADASDEEAARVFSIRKAGDAIPVAIKLPKTIALTLVKNGEETLDATLALTCAEGKTYQVLRDDAYALDFSLAGTVKGKAIEYTASLDHTADRDYELESTLKIDGENVLGIKAKGDNTPYDEAELAVYTGILEDAGGVWSALGKVLGFVNGRDLDSLEITIKDNIVIEGSVVEIGGMLAGLAQMAGEGEMTDEKIDAITAALNENVSYTVTQKNTGITAEGSFIAGDLFGAYLPQPALRFEGETEAQTIVSRLTEDDWANIARVLVVGVKAAGDISTIAETVKAKVAETKQQLADAAVAADAIDAIDAIGEVAYTEECEALIDAARKAYNALTDAQKVFVTNLETLTDAEAEYAELAKTSGFVIDADGVVADYKGPGGDVEITDGVTAIGTNAFASAGITSVRISASVTAIGSGAFADCESLMSIIFEGDAPTVAEGAFDGVPEGCVITVHAHSVGWGVPIPGTWHGLSIKYAETEVQFEAEQYAEAESNTVNVTVYGGSEARPTFVRVDIAYRSAVAADLDLAKGMIDGVVPKDGIKFPLTLAWDTGVQGTKTISIPLKADRLIENDEHFLLQLSDPVGIGIGDSDVCTVTILDRNEKKLKAAVASYKPKKGETATTNEIVVAASPEEGGFVAGSGLYTAGSKLTIVAEARPGWMFAGWRDLDSGEVVSEKARYQIAVSRDGSYCAEFQRQPYICGIAEPACGGSVSRSGYCPSGKRIALRAIPASSHYKFLRWEDELGNTVATTASLVIDRTTKPMKNSNSSTTLVGIDEDATFHVVFSGNPRVAVTPVAFTEDGVAVLSEGGRVTGAGLYVNGRKVALRANANKGFAFSGWYEADSGALVSQAATLSFAMTADGADLFARFVTTEEDNASISLAIDGVAMSRAPSDKPIYTNYCGVAVDWPVEASALSAPSVRVSGLPAGLRLVRDAKAGT